MPNPDDQDACELLDADHIAVKHLFVQYARMATAGLQGAGDRHAVAMKICEELTTHAQIEEQVFYPALERALPDVRDVLAEARAEHQQVKDIIGQLRSMGQADEQMDRLVAELAWAVEHHVKEERDELFPKVRAEPALDLQELAARLRERQQGLLQPSGAT